MMEQAGLIVGVLGLANLIGGMTFFGAIMAPLVFTRLPAEHAARLIRATFPRYYLFLLATSAVAALGFALVSTCAFVVMAAVALISAWLRFGLMPRINALRDAELAGDAEAGAAFARAHRLSVAVNQAQLVVAVGVLLLVLLS
jgi:hypothetical protein